MQIKQIQRIILCIGMLSIVDYSMAQGSWIDDLPKSETHQDSLKADVKTDVKMDENIPAKQIEPHTIIKGVKDDELMDNIHAHLDIYKYQDKPLDSESYANFLIELGKKQIKEALKPYGYYLAEVNVSVDKNNNRWQITYQIDKRTFVEVKSTQVTLSGEGLLNDEVMTSFKDFPIHQGDRLIQPKYEDYKSNLQKAALQTGFFDGKFEKKQIAISEDLKTATIQLDYDSGMRFLFGEVMIEQDFLDDDVFDRFKMFHPGDPYQVSAIANLQKGLYNSGYVDVIDVGATPDKDKKHVPVKLKITPNKNKAHTFKVGFGTDSGARAGYDFDWRWVNRRGHKLNYDVFASQNSSNMGVVYKIPGKHAATDNYNLSANISHDERNGRRSTTGRLSGEYEDKRNDLERVFGLELLRENFSVGNVSDSTTLVTPYARLKYKKTDDDLAITKGVLAEGSLVGSHRNFLSDVSFAQAKIKLGYLNKFAPKHKVKFFAGLGKTWVSDFNELPVSYRFFTGGDNTVRGYAFEQIGEQDNSGNVIGGDTLVEMSAEYEYFLKKNIAVAAFVDAGDAYSSGSPDLKVGAGLGFHYYLPIGPIRIDFAHGFDEKGDALRIHLNIGPEF